MSFQVQQFYLNPERHETPLSLIIHSQRTFGYSPDALRPQRGRELNTDGYRRCHAASQSVSALSATCSSAVTAAALSLMACEVGHVALCASGDDKARTTRREQRFDFPFPKKIERPTFFLA